MTTTEETIDLEVEDLAAHIEEILARVAPDLYDQPMVAQGEEWKDRAACKGMGDIFYPEDNHSHRGNLYDAARRVCAKCEVTEECAEAGKRDHFGMWGGRSPVERFPKRKKWSA